MSPMPGRNPYRPGVGLTPLYLAGRDGQIRRFASTLRGAPDIPANVRITGLRGVGKTVLLGQFERVAAEEDWAAASIELEHRHDSPEALVAVISGVCDALRAKLSRAARVRRQMGRAVDQVSRVNVGINEIKVSIDPNATDEDAELTEVLYETVVATTSRGKLGVVLMLDEVQVLEDPASLSVLIAAVSSLQRSDVPVGLVICGLPSLDALLLRARTYSERMFRGEVLGRLDDEAARDALVRPLDETGVGIDAELIDHVVRDVEGYPYFIQLWGAELWDTADHADLQQLASGLLDIVQPEIVRRLDVDFYEPRVQILTPAEQDVLVLTGECPYPPIKVSDVVEHSDRSMGNVNVLLGRIVNAGVLYRVRRGEYEYTAPRFHEFLQRRRRKDRVDQMGNAGGGPTSRSGS
ncbi:MAG TPA: ATP-binding protein [Acidimicrobiia bacterium]